MAAQSEGPDYFVLGSQLDYLRSLCLPLKTNHQRFALLLASWTFELCTWNGSFKLIRAAQACIWS